MTLSEGKESINSIVESLKDGLSKMRTGRANPDVLDSVVVNVYESEMPIKHIANVSVPDARTIVIQPWDTQNTEKIEKALLSSDIGMTPVVDGEIIRLSVPSLTQDLREQYVKEMKDMVEEARIAIREVRHRMMDAADKSAEGGGVSEDDIKRQKDAIENAVTEVMDRLKEVADNKEKELMTV
ncbi:ribosome recycling factor [Candidatus Dojkabacteria bacterium]|nr:ribosome recycling factor [Candidatus Dojkabacteria bacterium]